MAAAQADGVYEVTDVVEWAECISMGARDSRGMVALFTATFSGPCQSIEQVFHEQAARYPGIIFVIVDVDDAEEVADNCKPLVLRVYRQELVQLSATSSASSTSTITKVMPGYRAACS